MRILQISPQISYPSDSGGRLSIYGITKSLADKGHEITFVTYIKDYPKQEDINELKKICKPIFIEWDTRNKLVGAFLNLFSLVPYNISKYYSKKLENFLVAFLKNNEVDLVHIDHLHMAWTIDIIKKITKVPVVLREHNLEMEIMKRFAKMESNILLKYFATFQFKKFQHYEPNQCKKFDYCIMITQKDETSLLKLSPDIKTKVIPAGVDNKIFTINNLNTQPQTLFHIGSLEWQPNYDGLVWFLSEIFPEIVNKFPNTKLYIYSKGTEKLEISKEISNNVMICGYVKDIWQEIMDKQILIVPLRIGSGMRVKIIEMLAAGKIVVSTSIGKEGIEVKDGQEILIADNRNEFVRIIKDVFNNEIDTNNITATARNTMKKKYSWEKISNEFEKMYLDMIKLYKS
ncbi:MAG: glycosyltransferase [Ignavibacterium sp.]